MELPTFWDNPYNSLPGKLTTRSILSAPNEWFDLVEEWKEVEAELFDLIKVIDSVPHWQLIAKLQTSGLDIYTLKSYTGRMQNVVIKCGFFAAISSIVRSQVLQESALGPIFFPCVATCTCDAGISNGSKMRVFADQFFLRLMNGLISWKNARKWGLNSLI